MFFSWALVLSCFFALALILLAQAEITPDSVSHPTASLDDLHFDPATQFPSGGISPILPPKFFESTSHSHIRSQYAILIDAGSTGSRLSVYSFDQRVLTTVLPDCVASRSSSTCQTPPIPQRKPATPFSRPTTSSSRSKKVTPGLHTILLESVIRSTTTIKDNEEAPLEDTVGAFLSVHDSSLSILENTSSSNNSTTDDALPVRNPNAAVLSRLTADASAVNTTLNRQALGDRSSVLVYDTTISVPLLKANIESNLTPLIKFAVQMMEDLGATDQIPFTPLYLLATGGVRSLLEEERTVFMHVLRKYLFATGFYIEPSFITTVSGELEGLYGWISVNSLLSRGQLFATSDAGPKAHNDSNIISSNLESNTKSTKAETDHSEHPHAPTPYTPVGVIDLGGATLQMALAESMESALLSTYSGKRSDPAHDHRPDDTSPDAAFFAASRPDAAPASSFLSSYPFALGKFNTNLFLQCFWYYGKDTALFRIHNILYNVIFQKQLYLDQLRFISRMGEDGANDHDTPISGSSHQHDNGANVGVISARTSPTLRKSHPNLTHRPIIRSHVSLTNDMDSIPVASLAGTNSSLPQSEIQDESPSDFGEASESTSDISSSDDPATVARQGHRRARHHRRHRHSHISHHDIDDKEAASWLKEQLPKHFNAGDFDFSKYELPNDTAGGVHDDHGNQQPGENSTSSSDGQQQNPQSALFNTSIDPKFNQSRVLRVFGSPCLPRGYQTTFVPYTQLLSPLMNLQAPQKASNTDPVADTASNTADRQLYHEHHTAATQVVIVGTGEWNECYLLARELVISRTTTPCYNTNDLEQLNTSHEHHFEPNLEHSKQHDMTKVAPESGDHHKASTRKQPSLVQLNSSSQSSAAAETPTAAANSTASPASTTSPPATDKVSAVPPYTGQCMSFYGQYRPSFSDNTQFYLFSGFAYLGKILNLTKASLSDGSDEHLGPSLPSASHYVTPSVNLTYIQTKGQHLCSLPFETIGSMFPEENPYTLRRFCWFSAYIVALLHDGFRFDMKSNQLHFVSAVNHTDVTYSMGAMIKLANELPFHSVFETSLAHSSRKSTVSSSRSHTDDDSDSIRQDEPTSRFSWSTIAFSVIIALLIANLAFLAKIYSVFNDTGRSTHFSEESRALLH